MWEIGVWEQGDTLYETLRSRLPPGLAALERGSHPALLAGRRLDLLVAGEDAAGWAGCEVVRCGTALLPGQAETLCRALPCEQLILYGTGRACAVTLSSLGEERASVAIQRQLLRLDGEPADRQELVLPYDGTSPALFLALAGARLLLGLA